MRRKWAQEACTRRREPSRSRDRLGPDPDPLAASCILPVRWHRGCIKSSRHPCIEAAEKEGRRRRTSIRRSVPRSHADAHGHLFPLSFSRVSLLTCYCYCICRSCVMQRRQRRMDTSASAPTSRLHTPTHTSLAGMAPPLPLGEPAAAAPAAAPGMPSATTATEPYMSGMAPMPPGLRPSTGQP